ncbi:MAG: DMT family transporter [Ignisphaera sp.]
MGSRFLYYALLVVATVLWGSSFVFIKFSVESVSGFGYTFYRMLFAVALLTPVVLLRFSRGLFDYRGFVGGLAVGVTYMLGLLLQGIGTRYTLPSTSAFITGLNTVHVHAYCAFVERSYSLDLLASLLMALAGLYMVTAPSGGFGFGEAMVFAGSIAWGAQIVLVSRYGRVAKSYTDFLYGMFLPSLALAPYALVVDNPRSIGLGTWLYIAYLAVACSVAASYLQVIGQKHVNPAIASIIYLLEPFFALIFSIFIYGEKADPVRVVGGALIMLAIFVSARGGAKSSGAGSACSW